MRDSTAPQVGFSCLVFALLISSGAAAKDPRSPRDILQRVNELVGDEAKQWCEEAGVDYPPQSVVFRAFKKEGELEIWAASRGATPMVLVRTLPICAVAEMPGPKLKPYDKKTPEGFFHLKFLYNSKKPWMWVKLKPKRIDDFGVVGDGSSFYMHIDYPNPVDSAHSEAAGFRVPRGEICMHPNCATEGCVSFDNHDFLYVYAFARHHDVQNNGKVQLHLFPFRFDSPWEFDTEVADYSHLSRLGRTHLRRFWENLEQGFHRFNRRPRPLRFTFGVPTLVQGEVSRDVRRAKQALRRAGYDSGSFSSLFDDDFGRAVRAYQVAHGIAPTGHFDPETQGAAGLDWRTHYLFRR